MKKRVRTTTGSDGCRDEITTPTSCSMCSICDKKPRAAYSVILFERPSKRVTYDLSEVPVCSKACALLQYAELINAGIAQDALSVALHIYAIQQPT